MNSRWTVRIERKRLQLAVGVYPSERDPQPVLLSVHASGEAHAKPEDLAQCIDYEPLCHWLDEVWPHSSHVPLLETRINEVMAYVFGMDPRIVSVQVGLYKESMGRNALAVGMEREATRAQFAVKRQAGLQAPAVPPP